MKVSTLARALGLPAGSDNAACLAEIKRRKQQHTLKSRYETAAAVARLEAKFGIDSPRQDRERYLLADQIGPDRYRIDGKELSGAELAEAMRQQHEAEHALDDVLSESRGLPRGRGEVRSAKPHPSDVNRPIGPILPIRPH
jgi:hypothetical protein